MRSNQCFSRFAAIACTIVAVTVISAGCGNEAPPASTATEDSSHGHAHPSLPKTYAEAVTQITTHTQTVKDAFAAGTPETCDGALHSVADILNALPELAASAGMTSEDQESVRAAASKMFDAFMKIHEGFHGDQPGATLEEVQGDLDSTLATLTTHSAPTDQ